MLGELRLTHRRRRADQLTEFGTERPEAGVPDEAADLGDRQVRARPTAAMPPVWQWLPTRGQERRRPGQVAGAVTARVHEPAAFEDRPDPFAEVEGLFEVRVAGEDEVIESERRVLGDAVEIGRASCRERV